MAPLLVFFMAAKITEAMSTKHNELGVDTVGLLSHAGRAHALPGDLRQMCARGTAANTKVQARRMFMGLWNVT